jgi:hypothetical protein
LELVKEGSVGKEGGGCDGVGGDTGVFGMALEEAQRKKCDKGVARGENKRTEGGGRGRMSMRLGNVRRAKDDSSPFQPLSERPGG